MSSVIKIKLVVVGDKLVGKTTLLCTFRRDACPVDNIPSSYNVFGPGQRTVDVLINDNLPVEIDPWDTEGQDDYDRLRPLSYPDTDVFLICFAIDNINSYNNVTKKWFPETTRFCPDTPIILVGTKLDLRDDQEMVERLQQKSKEPLTISDGIKLQSMNDNVVKYMECSALAQRGVKEVFEEAARIALSKSNSKKCVLV